MSLRDLKRCQCGFDETTLHFLLCPRKGTGFPEYRETMTESDRDELARELGAIAYEDDVVCNYLRAAVGRSTERELFVAMVKHLVANRKQLREMLTRALELNPPPIVFKRE